MQVTVFSTNWPLFAATKPQAPSPDPGAPDLPADRQDPIQPAGTAGTSPRPAPKASPLPFASMMDALLDTQSLTAPLVFGADGKPDLLQSVIAGQPRQGGAPGTPGAIGGVQVMSWSDDGSADAVGLAGRDSADLAQELIQEAGSSKGLSLADVLKTMHIDTSTDAGKAVAQGVGFAWDRLTNGQPGPMSAADLAAAIQSYRTAHGDGVSAGGNAWRG